MRSASSLDCSGGRVELGLESVKRAELSVDEIRQLPAGFAAAPLARRGQIGPKDAVVHVATAIELNRGLQRNHGRSVAFGLGVRVLLNGGVVVGHIGVVMLRVVNL